MYVNLGKYQIPCELTIPGQDQTLAVKVQKLILLEIILDIIQGSLGWPVNDINAQ